VAPKINEAERAAKESDAGVSPEPHFFAQEVREGAVDGKTFNE
jgi:hypothetical protein